MEGYICAFKGVKNHFFHINPGFVPGRLFVPSMKYMANKKKKKKKKK